MTALRALVLLSLIGVVSPGFATDPAVPADSESVPVITLTPWRLLAYRVDGALKPVEPSEAPPQITFADGQVSGRVGCNSFTGGYSLDGDRLTIDPRMAMTMMACEEPLMAIDEAVIAHLKATTRYRVTGLRLELLDAEDTVLILLEALRETPLTGVTWRLDRYNQGTRTLVAPLAGTEITMTLSADGRVSGSDGCNRYMAGYSARDGFLSIRTGATTRMACRNPGVAEQATAFMQALNSVRRYRIDGNALWLTGDDGGTAAQFRVVPEPIRQR
jgi:heat shock protein HslJ